MVRTYLLGIGVPVVLLITLAIIIGWQESVGDGVQYLTDVTAFLFLLAALNGLIAYYAGRKGSEHWEVIFRRSMHQLAAIGTICLLVLGLTLAIVS